MRRSPIPPGIGRGRGLSVSESDESGVPVGFGLGRAMAMAKFSHLLLVGWDEGNVADLVSSDKDSVPKRRAEIAICQDFVSFLQVQVPMAAQACS